MSISRKRKGKQKKKGNYSFSDVEKMETKTESAIFGVLKKYPKTVTFVFFMMVMYVADLVLTLLMAFKLI